MQENDKAWRVAFLVKLVGVGMLFALGFQLVMVYYFGEEFAYGTFLFSSIDRFMDFFNVNCLSYDRDPYPSGTPYPPVALLVASVFSWGYDYAANGSLAARDSWPGTLNYLILTLVFASVLFLSLFRSIRTGHMRRDLLSAFTLGTCYPVLFLVDRGNYIMLAIVFVCGFVMFFRNHRLLSILCLALAISMKIYPVLFVALLLSEKRLKDTAVVVGMTVAFNLAALCVFKSPVDEGVAQFLGNVSSFSNGFKEVTRDSGWNTSFTNLLRIPVGLLSPTYEGQWVIPSLILSLVLVSALAYYLWREPAFSKRVLALTIISIGLQGNSPDYNLVYLLIPLMVYLNEARGRTRFDYFLLTGIGLLLIPKGYVALRTSLEYVLTIQAFLNPLLLLILFVGLIATAPHPQPVLSWSMELFARRQLPQETRSEQEPALT
jgi:hypothetical protein